MTRTVRTIIPMCGIIAGMVRVLTGLAAWLAGSALAVSLAWFGAGMVVRNTGMTPSVPVISAGPTAPSSSAPPSSSTPVSPHQTAKAASAPASAAPRSSASPISSATTGAGDGTVHGYTLTGGRVTLLVRSDSAQLVTAVPTSGYSVQTWSGPGWLRVDFSSGPQVSSLIASWNGHPPSIIVTN